MKDIEVREVVISTLTIRGTGNKKSSPIRRITQVFEKDGTLIAENDPDPVAFDLMDLVHFTNWFNDKYPHTAPSHTDVEEWLEYIENKNS